MRISPKPEHRLPAGAGYLAFNANSERWIAYLNFGHTSDGVKISKVLTSMDEDLLWERVLVLRAAVAGRTGRGLSDSHPGKWMDRAACRGRDPETFFKSHPADLEAVAKTFCSECPVRPNCLAYGLAGPLNAGNYGVWGGTTPRHRKRLARDREAGLRIAKMVKS